MTYFETIGKRWIHCDSKGTARAQTVESIEALLPATIDMSTIYC